MCYEIRTLLAGELATERGTSFNVDFDFATVLSSLVPCCILFDIDSEQLAELKMLILNLIPTIDEQTEDGHAMMESGTFYSFKNLSHAIRGFYHSALSL